MKRHVRILRCLEVVCLCLGLIRCNTSPTGPTTGFASTPTSASTATIHSVITTFRGIVIESSPVVVDWPEALQVEIRFAAEMPSDSRMTMYLCVMETVSAIGVGTCNAVTDSVASFRNRGDVVGMGINAFQADRTPATTGYVYVAITEGALPWPFVGMRPPQLGETFVGNRVLATFQAARTVTFR